ncbi:sulfotransferase family protein [Falsirhodobacter sp. 1013]|uniref:sulfotransferase family protein n=1 Tax=Falsirhodobacter sp. 1013 TaxID=3417566 RepID=UPI003EBFFEDF
MTGVARSGTTALAELLNSHHGICLGIERFKFQFLRRENFTPKLFGKERFFDFKSSDTNLRPDVRPAWTETYDRIAVKWDTARIVGDKVPDLTPVLPQFIARNPGFRYIYILRNLKDVALSWQARADRKRDPWPQAKDFGAACESWAQQNRQLLDHLATPDRPDNLLLLDYDTMFDDPDRTERTLLDFLGLERDPQMRETLDRHVAFAATRTERPATEDMAALHDATDRTAHAKLCRMAQTWPHVRP